MTAKMTDTAALAAIGAAGRELRMSVVRAEAGRLAELEDVPLRVKFGGGPLR